MRKLKYFLSLIAVMALISVMCCACNKTPTTYKVTFLDNAGALLDEQTVEAGANASEPILVPNEGYHYVAEFSLDELKNIQSDKTFTYTYEQYIFTVIFKDNQNNILDTQKVEKGQDAVLPTLVAETGYTYVATFESKDLTQISQDTTFVYNLVEAPKTVNYYIDGELVSTWTGLYSEEATEPSYDKTDMINPQWLLESKDVVEGVYVYNYKLDYSYTTYTIKYLDNKTLLDLTPNSYNSHEVTVLPIPEKEGYIFVGWFMNEISLAEYKETEIGMKDNVVFYARWVESVSHETYVLPAASAHFTGINAIPENGVTIYQPKFPDGAKSMNPTDYTFTVSDDNILGISVFGSLSIRRTGYAVITATYTADSSYKINAIFKTTVDGISIATPEEANMIELVTISFKGKDGEDLGSKTITKGTFVTLPTPPTYEGYTFAGWDHENLNLTEDTTFTATYKTDINNKFVGKTISFIGDSLTSYWSYIPSGYESFLPYPTGDVTDVNETWWMRTVNQLGARMFVNNSYGGTCVYGGTQPTSSSSRLVKLLFNKHYADVTMIYMGSNDCAASVKYPETYNPTTFGNAYRSMIKTIQGLCPNTEIILFTLAHSNSFSYEVQESFNTVIRNLAQEFNLELVELRDLDLTKDYGQKVLVDSGHPMNYGNYLIFKEVYSKLTELK